jgi:transposase
VEPAATGRPSYHPSSLFIYGYLNRVQSSRRLEREAGRNVEAMWLLGRLVPDHKTIADFRKTNGPTLRNVCARFVDLCRQMGLLTKAACHRRQQVQSREQSRQELHARQSGTAACAARGERRVI